jgi:hypothetical protein
MKNVGDAPPPELLHPLPSATIATPSMTSKRKTYLTHETNLATGASKVM